jgi:hypothetical protein
MTDLRTYFEQLDQALAFALRRLRELLERTAAERDEALAEAMVTHQLRTEILALKSERAALAQREHAARAEVQELKAKADAYDRVQARRDEADHGWAIEKRRTRTLQLELEQTRKHLARTLPSNWQDDDDMVAAVAWLGGAERLEQLRVDAPTGGEFDGERCPKCGASTLRDKYGRRWCSYVGGHSSPCCTWASWGSLKDTPPSPIELAGPLPARAAAGPDEEAKMLEATTRFIAHFMETTGSLQDRARAGLAAAFPILRTLPPTPVDRDLLRQAKRVAFDVCAIAPGYDWNADPRLLTRLIGDLGQAIDKRLAEGA